MQATKELKSLKKGEYFTLKPIEYPNVMQVYVKDSYDYSLRKYEVYKYGDVNFTRFLKGNTKVYTDFIF